MKTFAILCCAFVLGNCSEVLELLFNNRIVNGQDAERYEFPHQVSLQTFFGHFCGGSIISDEYILTAGHCAKILKPNFNFVVAGILNLNDTTDEKQQRNVKEVIVHENYSITATSVDNDIAVLKLESKLLLGKAVKPINLPESGIEFNGSVVASGWGQRETHRHTNTLQKVLLDIFSENECKQSISNFAKVEQVICVNGENPHKGGCFGDSGSPLTYYNDQQSTVIGVASFVTDTDCSKGPTGYTKVSHYRDWIKKKTQL